MRTKRTVIQVKEDIIVSGCTVLKGTIITITKDNETGDNNVDFTYKGDKYKIGKLCTLNPYNNPDLNINEITTCIVNKAEDQYK